LKKVKNLSITTPKGLSQLVCPVKNVFKLNLPILGYEESAELMNNLIKLRDNIYVNNAQNLKKIFELERDFIDKFQTKSRYIIDL